MIKFFIPGEPPTATAQQKGYNRKTGRYYKPAELKDAESKYQAYAAEVRPKEPITGPVRLVVVFGFTPTTGHNDGEYKITKPDTDNMLKALKDSLTRCRFWRDDCQVAEEITLKVWSRVPGVTVTVEALGKEMAV